MRLNIFIALAVGLLTYGLTVYLNRSSAPPVKIIQAPAEIQNGEIGGPVPSFSFTDINGRTHTIEDFRGKVILLNFWASWCPPCVEEFPLLLEIATEQKQNAVLIALSADLDETAIWRFIDTMQIDTRQDHVLIALDKKSRIAEKLFQTFRLPETIIIDKNQKLRQKFVGTDWTKEDLTKLISELKKQ